MDIWGLVLQSVSVLVVVLTFVIIQASAAKARQVKMLDELKRQLIEHAELMEKHLLEQAKRMEKWATESIERLTEELKTERDNRVSNVNRLHARIDEMQNGMLSDLQHRLSNIEGELKGFRGPLEAIQNWFINQAKTR